MTFSFAESKTSYRHGRQFFLYWQNSNWAQEKLIIVPFTLAYIVKIKENLEEYQNHINLDGMNK